MNLLITTGRLTKDSILRFTASGTPVLNFTVATDVGFGESKHGVFIDCSLFGKRAESLDPYLLKGSQVTVQGEADLRLWESGEKHGANITCNISDVVLQGSKSEADTKEKPQGFRKPQNDFGDDDLEDVPF